jgi:PAS domain S-box-containing protein
LAEFTDPRFRWARAFVGDVEGWKDGEFICCRHLAASAGPMAISDLQSQSHLEGCALVRSSKKLRSCASVPVRGPGGETVGWLSALDYQPNRWQSEYLSALGELAALMGEILDWIASGVGPSAESGLQTVEHRLRALFDNTTDLIYTQNLKGEITAVNSAAERLLGYQREELLGRSVASLVSPTDEDRARQMALIHFGGSGPQSFELEFRARDGRPVPLEVSTHLLFEQGMPVGLIAFGRNRFAAPQSSASRSQLHARLAELRTTGERLAPRLVEFEGALRKALDNEELELRFQPILTVAGELYGIEALLAWRHPSGRLVSAEQFIRVAEDTGLIAPIGARVLERACRLAAGWQKGLKHPLHLAVNVSADHFAEQGFPELVAATLRQTGFPAELLELEITESALMRDLPSSIEAMAQIRRLGVRISIDDFGTGYSSLAYLDRLPADVLKVDRSFFRPTDAPKSSVRLLHGIVALARSLGLVTVAEGVETAAQWELARRAGFDLVQGHLFGRPVPARAMRRRLGRYSPPR